MSLSDLDVEVASALTRDDDEVQSILQGFEESRTGDVLVRLSESYGTLGYWYAYAKRRKRGANGDKADWQFYEDYLEAALKALQMSAMIQMSLNKAERFNG